VKTLQIAPEGIYKPLFLTCSGLRRAKIGCIPIYEGDLGVYSTRKGLCFVYFIVIVVLSV
jgi:hypothetical protein